jgi:hypothetical protein
MYLVDVTESLNATDPRDEIYALLGVYEVRDIFIDPDYTKSTLEVYRELMTKYIETHHDLSIICKSGIGTARIDEPLGLPSWAPDFIGSNLGSTKQVSRPLTPFIASKSCASIYDFRFGSQILSSREVICDIITDYRSYQDPPSGVDRNTYDRVSTYMDWSELALTLVGVPHPTGISQYQAFFSQNHNCRRFGLWLRQTRISRRR